MCNQTFEHLYNPYLAMKRINEHLIPGGYFYTNVPCNNIPHDTPFHYYTGYTSVGLGAIFVDSGFEIVKLGQWGNRDFLFKMFTNNDWPDYKNSIWENEKDCPVICWCLGRKVR